MKLIYKIKLARHKAYIEYFRRLPVQNNKIIFWANSFKHFGCNPKYIALYLLNHYPGRFDLVWVFENGMEIPEGFPEGIRVVRFFSIDYLKELHTAKFIICNMRTGKAHYWHKRAEQIYIQTWHSSLRLKKVEGDAPLLPQQYVDSAKQDSQKIDLLISGCRLSTEIYKRAFWYDGAILESGTPRCDILLNNMMEARGKVFRYYDIPADRKLVLYAPTFRTNKTSDFLGMDFCRVRESLGETWVVGARLHPNVSTRIIPKDAINMSKYSDMQELIAAADVLITDFSSCMFDMAIAQKPCVLYAPDLDDYLQRERGLYFNLNELPFPIAESMDELCGILNHFDYDCYNSKVKCFMDSIGSFERGHATEEVCKFILEHVN